jgi:hypothetical protein
MDQLAFETTVSALREKKKLRRHFRRFDIFFYLICTVVTLDTIGDVASNGAQGFTWLIFLGIFFFLPYALSVAELGSAFPQEGGPYVWTRLAFGRPLAAVNSVIYWISNPIWVCVLFGYRDDARVRDPDPVDPDRAPGEPGVRVDRVPGRHQGRLYRLRRSCLRERDRDAAEPG